ncbi:hypothetical protein Dsin_019110 [Dipteronia sinensis]|uniref:Uncharacterized protein n=1 Tax=Dipteronia sinensis TaxID=43782 RepID=A0AAE0E3R0_9ROSI|nr:hypothetical protein Dsin_019110 [Dipteronia sinensis]
MEEFLVRFSEMLWVEVWPTWREYWVDMGRVLTLLERITRWASKKQAELPVENKRRWNVRNDIDDRSSTLKSEKALWRIKMAMKRSV